MAAPQLATEGTRIDPLELIVKIAGLLVLTLPLVGIGVRLVAFQSAGMPDALRLATRDSVVGLATTAFIATWPSVFVVIGLSIAAHRGWMSGQRPPALAPSARLLKWLKWSARAYRASFAIAVIVIALTFPWPAGVFLVAAGAGGGMAIGWLNVCRRLTIYTVALLVVLVGIANAAGAGLEGNGVGDELNMYYFASKAGLPADGRYVVLGQADGVLYLQSCGANKELLAVNNQDVARLTPTQVPDVVVTPSLVDIVIRHRSSRIGYHPNC